MKWMGWVWVLRLRHSRSRGNGYRFPFLLYRSVLSGSFGYYVSFLYAERFIWTWGFHYCSPTQHFLNPQTPTPHPYPQPTTLLFNPEPTTTCPPPKSVGLLTRAPSLVPSQPNPSPSGAVLLRLIPGTLNFLSVTAINGRRGDGGFEDVAGWEEGSYDV